MWDFLHQRYSNPALILDQFIQEGCLLEGLARILEITNAERKEKAMWEMWIHKVHDKTWEEFSRAVEPVDTIEATQQVIEITKAVQNLEWLEI